MRALYIILLLGLFLWGYNLCKKRICGNSDTTAAAAAPVAGKSDGCNTSLMFKDGDNLSVESQNNFTFDLSDDKFISPDEDFLTTTMEVIDYLEENSDRVMQIKAYYVEDEKNETESKSLGHARAKNIASFFKDQGVDPSQLQIIGKRTMSSCVEDGVLMKGCTVAFGGKK